MSYLHIDRSLKHHNMIKLKFLLDYVLHEYLTVTVVREVAAAKAPISPLPPLSNLEMCLLALMEAILKVNIVRLQGRNVEKECFKMAA